VASHPGFERYSTLLAEYMDRNYNTAFEILVGLLEQVFKLADTRDNLLVGFFLS
jgi:hypothetical protein